MDLLNQDTQLTLSSLSKKELKQEAIEHYQEAVDGGYWYANEIFTFATKLQEYSKGLIEAAKDETVNSVDKSLIVNGVELTAFNTGQRLNYEEDERYAELKAELKERESLLKLAFNQKSNFYTEDGFEVPKVSVKSGGYKSIKTKY
jgi:hypothetical protein